MRDFHNSASLNAFESKAATNAVIAGHFSKDIEVIYFIPFSLRDSGRGASQMD